MRSLAAVAAEGHVEVTGEGQQLGLGLRRIDAQHHDRVGAQTVVAALHARVGPASPASLSTPTMRMFCTPWSEAWVSSVARTWPSETCCSRPTLLST